jgi:hypothetical protein
MTQVTTELLYEVLGKIEADVATIKVDLSDVKAMQLRLRVDFNRFEGGVSG